MTHPSDDTALSAAELAAWRGMLRVQASLLRALDADLRATRGAAQQRLADAVAALEAIRLNLLRLCAGGGSVDSLTADLSAARDVGAEVDRLLAGHEEVAALLARPASS